MLSLRVHYFPCILAILLAWQPCHAGDSVSGPKAGWEKFENTTKAAHNNHEIAQTVSWEKMRLRVLQKWADGAIPERRIFVEYFNEDSSRIKVDYENGTVTVETLIGSNDGHVQSTKIAKSNIENVLSTIVSHDSKSAAVILSSDEITGARSTKQEIISSLTQNVEMSGIERGEDDQPRKLHKVTFKLVPDYVKRRAAKFRPIVEEWAKKYNLDPAYILGLIRQESSFNPRARSPVGAIGLMQIMPQFAGLEVFEKVTGKPTIPTAEYLYDPTKNIMVGVTYLQLLRDQYFPGIKDEEKRRFLITCSYNWGPHRIKKAISNGRISIRVPASDLFNRLQQITPAETSDYLRKVTQYAYEFKYKN
jgi:membrane-bound lytic murein transglycosylase C